MEITAALVKKLRDLTGAGILECKKALTEVEGDLDKAIEFLREKGALKAAKKGSRIAAEGLSRASFRADKAVIFELNSETDFVAKNELFIKTMDAIENALYLTDSKTVEEFLNEVYEGQTINELLIQATATIGEKISLRRFEVLTKNANQSFGSYVHMGGKLAGLAQIDGDNPQVAEQMAIQAVVMSPLYLSRADLNPQELAKEENLIREQIMNDEAMNKKPANVIDNIVKGRLNQSLKETVLLEQAFYEDANTTVEKYLESKKVKLVKYVRYATGEGIEKKEDNFVEEVMNQAFGK